MDFQLACLCMLTFVVHFNAAIAGALAVPTFQRIFSRAVRHFQVNRSIPRLLLRGFAKGGLASRRLAGWLEHDHAERNVQSG